MPQTDVDTGNSIYPANHGPSNTALARDQENYSRKMVKGANFVAEGGVLVYGAGSLQVTLQALTAFIDGRQAFYIADGSYTFTLPPNETNYLMIDRSGKLFYRDTNNPTADEELVLWKMVTDGTGVTAATQDLRRLNQFTEVGLNDGEFIYFDSARTKTLRYNPGSGRVELVGVLQPTRILGLPTPTDGTEAVPLSFALNVASAKQPVESKTVSTPPGSPADGERYIVGPSPTGAWFGHANEIAQYSTASSSWVFTVPTEGFLVWVKDEDRLTVYDGANWVDLREYVQPKTADWTAVQNNRYFGNHGTPGTRIVATLPQTPADSDFVYVEFGSNTGGGRIKENATTPKPIKFGSSTSSGAGTDYWQTLGIRQAMLLRYDADESSGVWNVVWATGQWDNTANVRQHLLDSTKPLRGTDAVAGKDLVTLDQLNNQYTRPTLTYMKAIHNKIVAVNGNVTQEGMAVVCPSNDVHYVFYQDYNGASFDIKVRKTTDGGVTWSSATTIATNVGASSGNRMVAWAVSATTVYLVSCPVSGNVSFYKTTDGSTWSSAVTVHSATNSTSVSMWVNGTGTDVYVLMDVSTGNALLSKSSDSGGSFSALTTPGTGQAGPCHIVREGTQTLHTVLEGVYRKSTNDGSTWATAVTFGSGTLKTAFFRICANGDYNVVGFEQPAEAGVAVGYILIYRSTDAGVTWTSSYDRGLEVGNSTAVRCTDHRMMVCPTDGRLYTYLGWSESSTASARTMGALVNVPENGPPGMELSGLVGSDGGNQTDPISTFGAFRPDGRLLLAEVGTGTFPALRVFISGLGVVPK